MAAVVGSDVTQIQDEDLLRRMWQETEDFGRKKEIRARMYKLREQRLKEFYTTGEVLSDVLTTGSLEPSSIQTRTHSSSSTANSRSQQVVHKSSSYTTLSSGENYAITHADSIGDEGFMTLKSKEIRDSESPTRDFHRRQQTNQSKVLSNSEFQDLCSQDDGRGGYWKVVQESSSGEYHATGKTGDNGEMIIQSKTRTGQSKVVGGSDTDGLSCVSQVSESGDTRVMPAQEGNALKDVSNDENTSVVISKDVGGRSISSSSSKSWSSSSQSQREQKVSSSSQSKSFSTVVHKDSGFSEDFHNKDTRDVDDTRDSSADHTERRSSSSRKTSQGKHRITQRSSTTDMPVGELCIARDIDPSSVPISETVVVKTTQVGDKIITDIKVSGIQETRSSKVTENRVTSEEHHSGSQLITQKGAVTTVTPADTVNWTVVSSQTTGKDGKDKTTEEFVFRSGHNDSQEQTSRVTSTTVSREDASIISSKDDVDRGYQVNRGDDISPQRKEVSPEKQPSTPTEPIKKGIMKQPSQEKIISPDQYVTTYQQHFTSKRISVDTDANHDAFARSLRSSPERGTPTSTRSSSKVSLDRVSPTRCYRNKTSTDSSLASLNRVSPSRTSPSRASPEKTLNRSPSPQKTGIRNSPTRKSPEKTTGIDGSPKDRPRASPEKSPARDSSPDKAVRKPSYSRVSPDKVNKTEPETSITVTTNRTVRKTSQVRENSDNISNRASPVKGLKEPFQQSPSRETSPSKIARRSSSARSSPDKDAFGTLKRKTEDDNAKFDKSPKEPSRRVSAGDRPKTDVHPKGSTVTKDKRKLSSTISRETTKKKCSTPGISPATSPTHFERQSRPRSRGSSRASTDSEGSDNETSSFIYAKEEDTRKYQKSVTDREEELFGARKIQNVVIDNKNESTTRFLEQEGINNRAPLEEPSDRDSPIDIKENTTVNKVNTISTESDIINVAVTSIKTDKTFAVDSTKSNVPDEHEAAPETSRPLQEKSRPIDSPVSNIALTKLPREKSPEYSSEGSLANELPRRPKGNTERNVTSPVKQVRGIPETRDSPDSSPERTSFAPIKCFRTSPENRPTMLDLNGTQAPKPTLAKPPQSPASPTKPFKPYHTDTSEHIDDIKSSPTSIKEPIKPGKPLSSRPAGVGKSPERPNSSPVSHDTSRQSPRKESLSAEIKPAISSENVPELTRRSPTPEDQKRRRNQESKSSSVSPCSSPERYSDRENIRTEKPRRESTKKPRQTDSSPRDSSPDNVSPKRTDIKRRPEVGKSPQKSVIKKVSDSTPTKKTTRESTSHPDSPTNVCRGISPSQKPNKDATTPASRQPRKPSIEKASPERRSTHPSRGDNDDKSPRPSSIPRPGQKTPDSVEKPFVRKPSWSKTLRGSDMPKESQKIKQNTKPVVGNEISPSHRKPQVSTADTRTTSKSKPLYSPQRSHPSPSSSPERPSSNKQQKKKLPGTSPDDAKTVPVKSAFVRTNIKTETTRQITDSSKTLESSKVTPKISQPKVCTDDGQSTDRSSTVSSPETVRPAKDVTKKRTEVYVPQLSSPTAPEDIPVSLSQVTGDFQPGDTIEIKITKTKEPGRPDYVSDECDDIMNETPPEEFLVDDDSPVASKVKPSSIPKPSSNTPSTFKTTITKKTVETRNQVKKPSQSSPSPVRVSLTKITSKPTSLKKHIVTTTITTTSKMPQKPKLDTGKTFKTVATFNTRIDRTSNDTTKRTVPTTNGIQNNRVVPKTDTRVSQNSLKTTTLKSRSTVQQKAGTTTSVTSRVTTTKSVQSPTSKKPGSQAAQTKPRPADKSKPTGKLAPTTKPVKQSGIREPSKHVNGVSRKQDIPSSSDEEGLPEQCPSLVDTDDEYIREMETLRQDEESQYAMKVTSREDAFLSVCQDKLKTSRDSLTIADIRLKSSRESSPDFKRPRSVGEDVLDLRPRFADRVSEPEDDDEHFRKPDSVRFQRPVLHPEPLDEEAEPNSKAPVSGKVPPKVYPKSILVDNKTSELTSKLINTAFLQDEVSISRLLQEIDKNTSKNTCDNVSLSYPEGEIVNRKPSEYPSQPQEKIDDEWPKKPSEYLKKSTPVSRSEPRRGSVDYPSQPDDETDDERQKRPVGYPQDRPVQVTDLDASDTEEATRTVSVSDRVSHFLETARSQSKPATHQPTEPTAPSGLDSPSAVRKARAMFETIATTQKTSPQSPRQIDILSRPSVFEARRQERGVIQEKTQLFQEKSDDFTLSNRRTSYVNEYPSDDDVPHTKTSPDSSTNTHPRKRTSPERQSPDVHRNVDEDSFNDFSRISDKTVLTKTSTDTFIKRKETSPERKKSDSPKVTPCKDKRIPGKINMDTFNTFNRPKASPASVQPDSNRRRKSPERPNDYGTYSKPKSQTDRKSPERPSDYGTYSKPKSQTDRKSPERPGDYGTYSKPKSQTDRKSPERPGDYGTYSKPKSQTDRKSPERPGDYGTYSKPKSQTDRKSPERPGDYGTYSKPKSQTDRKSPERPGDYGTYSKPKSQTDRKSPERPGDYGTYSKPKSQTDRTSPERPGDYGTYTKPKSQVDRKSPERPGDYGTYTKPKSQDDHKSPERSGDYGTYTKPKSLVDRKSPEHPGDFSTYTKPKSQPDKQSPSDKYASFPSQTRGTKPSEEMRPQSPSKTYRPISPTRIETDDYDSPSRKDSPSTRTTSQSPVRKESVPKKDHPQESPYFRTKPEINGYREPTDVSPARKQSFPRESSPKRTSPTKQFKESHSPEREFPRKSSTSKPSVPSAGRSPSTDQSPRRTSRDNIPRDAKRPAPTEESILTKRGSAVFGVALRSTSTTTQRRRSGDATPKVTPVDDDEDIENIFDIDLLETMLEKATGYDRRRRLRAQIRIVRRQIEESSTTVTTTMSVTSVEECVTPRKPSVQEAGTTPSKPFQNRSPEAKPERRPSDNMEFPARSPSPGQKAQRKPSPQERRPSDTRDFQARSPSPDQKPQGRKPSDSRDFQTRPSQDYKPQGRKPSDSRDFQARSPSPDQKPVGRRPSDSRDFQTRSQSPDQKPVGRKPSDSRDFQTRVSPDTKPQGRRPSDSRDFPARSSFPDQKPQGRKPSDSRDFQTRPSQDYKPQGRRPSDSRDFPARSSSPDQKPQGRKPSDSRDFQTRPFQDYKPQGRRPSDSQDFQARSPSPDQKPVGRKPSDSRDFQTRSQSPDQKPVGRRPLDSPDFSSRTRDIHTRSPSPEFKPQGRRPSETTVDRSSTLEKKHSKTELTIELKPAKTTPVKTPTKKWSVGEKPQEVCPVTSSYGVGPTDENGRPLFGLKALRKSHPSQTSIDVDLQPSAPKFEESPIELSDRGGLPLFGGLRALKVSSATSTSSSVVDSSITNRTSIRRDSGSVISKEEEDHIVSLDDDMPEQPESPQLKDLVSRHEQQFRSSSVTQPLQKPKAKLRDSFIMQTSSNTESRKVEDTSKALSLRGQSLKSLIQKHESITKDEEKGFVPRSGFLKGSRDGVITEGSSVSTVVTSRGTLRSDGTVSLSRDIITGETVMRPGEEPLTKVTRTQQRYNTPKQSTPAVQDVDSWDDLPSNRKSSSPDRFTSGTTITSSSCVKRLEGEDVTSSKPQHKTDEKFTNSSILSRSKFIDEVRSNRKTSPARASPEKEGRFTSSTTAVLSRRPSDSSPTSSVKQTSVRRQIFNENEANSELSNTTTRQEKYTSSTVVTNTSQVSSFEEKYSTGGVENRRTSQGYIVEYDDDDESDGYQRSSRYIEDCSKSSSPRASPEKGTGFKKTDGKVLTTRRSSTQGEDGERTSTVTKRGVTRGNSVKALQQKFQQAAGSPAGSSPSSNTSTPRAETANRSFLDNQTRVTGVQDILTRMRNADQVVESGDTPEDSEARALLNKFLGAQVILQGMEPLMQASQPSAALVSQVERQRVLTSTSSSSKTQASGVVNGKEQDIEEIWDEAKLRKLLDSTTDYEARRNIRARLRVVMAEQKACSDIVTAALADEAAADKNNQNMELRSEQGFTESKTKSSSVEGNVTTKTEVTTRTSSFSATAVGSTRVVSKAPSGKVMSPFSKFQQMDRQNSQSAPNSPKTPGGTSAGPLFTFTDPKLCRSASGVKDRLLFWCQVKTKEYKNIQIENFSTSWSNGLAFCALIHHFLPEAFDYDSLKPEERRKNFELAFRIADEKADIAPLLDVEDMVMMRKPDWKCVFTYVQSIYRRFKDQD